MKGRENLTNARHLPQPTRLHLLEEGLVNDLLEEGLVEDFLEEGLVDDLLKGGLVEDFLEDVFSLARERLHHVFLLREREITIKKERNQGDVNTIFLFGINISVLCSLVKKVHCFM